MHGRVIYKPPPLPRPWNSVVGLLGGVVPIVTQAFSDTPSLWDRFSTVVQREHYLAFGVDPLPGHDLLYALPTMEIPTATLGNFTGC